MDIYSKEVKYLTEHPDEIINAWAYGLDHSPLFDACDTKRLQSNGTVCGCLTQIRSGAAQAATKQLTKAIKTDSLLPSNQFSILPKHLKRFAYWQRKLDRMLKTRKKPVAPDR